MKLRRLLVHQARSRGWIVARWPYPGTIEALTKELLRQRQVSLVIDVGAHIGRYGEMLRKIGYEGTILSIEPDPRSFPVLQRRAALDAAWLTRQCAASDRSGEETFHLYDRAELSSLHEPTALGATSYSMSTSDEVTVSVQTLDQILIEAVPSHDRLRVLLKVDTQGSDAAILRGAAGALESVEVLQTEVAVQQLYEQVPPLHERLRSLDELGFVPAGMFPVQRDSGSGAAVELDYVGVRARPSTAPPSG